MFIIFDLDDTLIDTSRVTAPAKLERALLRMQQVGGFFSSFSEALEELLALDRVAERGEEALRSFWPIIEIRFSLPPGPTLLVLDLQGCLQDPLVKERPHMPRDLLNLVFQLSPQLGIPHVPQGILALWEVREPVGELVEVGD